MERGKEIHSDIQRKRKRKRKREGERKREREREREQPGNRTKKKRALVSSSYTISSLNCSTLHPHFIHTTEIIHFISCGEQSAAKVAHARRE